MQGKSRYDVNLMDATQQWNMNTVDMAAFNRYRIFLQAIFLSNIVNTMGNRISKKAFLCERRLPSRLKWPLQIHPTARDCKLWRRLLSEHFLSSLRFHILRQPLGEWEANSAFHRRLWPASFNLTQTKVLWKRKSQWIQQNLQISSRSSATFGGAKSRSRPSDGFLILAQLLAVTPGVVYFHSYLKSTPKATPDCRPPDQFIWSQSISTESPQECTCQCIMHNDGMQLVITTDQGQRGITQHKKTHNKLILFTDSLWPHRPSAFTALTVAGCVLQRMQNSTGSSTLYKPTSKTTAIAFNWTSPG